MPTATFYNLPAEKKAAIIASAEHEFSQYNFYDASINRIIKSAGIPRGSFYMYFENKEDLFFYLLAKVRNKLFIQLAPLIVKRRNDILGFYLELYDIVVEQIFSSRHKEFLLGVFINMNAMTLRHLMDFVVNNKEAPNEKPIIAAQKYFVQLRALNDEESLCVIEFLRDALLSGIVTVCMNEMSVTEMRRNLELKTQLLAKLL
ncbi:TetR/AcrR family transcriptional regulator [Culicoidibacter larvae]|uniref:TetR/AcrR family transcriptional regulator n=1 Tax=Culicoidibacter larvae TaxID=2579976 RepID=A0A5R8QDY6_9FIRM|nr:TetR/AcrR family transcriptional regulator [Culicoidibacter larvae]TLG74213.1 TetR/AcrR family transcriptional regulator [Culicoidibacter larvae]